MNKTNYILGIDGGGSKTRGYIFNNKGETLIECNTTGTNLYVYKDQAVKILINLIKDMSIKSSINLSEITAFGFGLAGVSEINYRELLIKELDRNGDGIVTQEEINHALKILRKYNKPKKNLNNSKVNN